MNNTLIGRDIFMRYTDDKGKTHVHHHRVWDAPRFVAAREAEAAEENAKRRHDAGLRKAEQITKEQYRKERT